MMNLWGVLGLYKRGGNSLKTYEPEDIVQNTMVKVLKHGSGSFYKCSRDEWFGLFVNAMKQEVVDMIKYDVRSVRGRYWKRVTFEVADGVGGDGIDRAILREDVRRAIEQLPDECCRRRIAELYLGGRIHEEIAAETRYSLSSVDKRVTEIKSLLRRALRAYEFESKIILGVTNVCGLRINSGIYN